MILFHPSFPFFSGRGAGVTVGMNPFNLSNTMSQAKKQVTFFFSTHIAKVKRNLVCSLNSTSSSWKVDGEWKVCVVGEGFADVTRDFVVIVVDTVERPEDIDIIRAREAKTRAEERLKQKQSRLQYYHTQQHCHVLWHD